MTKKIYEDKLFLDIPFGEALERFAKTDAKEVTASVARAKKAKPSSGKINKSPDIVDHEPKVVRLGNKRKPRPR